MRRDDATMDNATVCRDTLRIANPPVPRSDEVVTLSRTTRRGYSANTITEWHSRSPRPVLEQGVVGCQPRKPAECRLKSARDILVHQSRTRHGGVVVRPPASDVSRRVR
jgi:hypothetical protein